MAKVGDGTSPSMAQRRQHPAHQRRLASAERAVKRHHIACPKHGRQRRPARAIAGSSSIHISAPPGARQGNQDAGSLADDTAQLDRAAMRFDELPGERKAEPKRSLAAPLAERVKRSNTRA